MKIREDLLHPKQPEFEGKKCPHCGASLFVRINQELLAAAGDEIRHAQTFSLPDGSLLGLVPSPGIPLPQIQAGSFECFRCKATVLCRAAAGDIALF